MRVVEWDEAKRRANLEKHGTDFADVPFMDWDNATILEDSRFDYPEPRFWAFGMFGGGFIWRRIANEAAQSGSSASAKRMQER